MHVILAFDDTNCYLGWAALYAFCNSTPTPNSHKIPPSNMDRASTPKGVERAELQWGFESQNTEGELGGGLESQKS